MKTITKQLNRKPAFTIVELLTVMSIIVILIGLLVPALNKVKRFARDVKQRAQLHSMDAAIELFNSEHDGYPPSSAKDEAPPPTAWVSRADYCGAMKLAEAMMGQDLLGFHPDSAFRSDGTPGSGATNLLYLPATLNARKGPYLQLESANAYKMGDLYWEKQMTTGPFREDLYVLCDGYNRVTNRSTGKKIGMPILYYKANTTKTAHDVDNPDNPNNIYNYLDNFELVALGMPGQDPADMGGPTHDLNENPPLKPGGRFYRNTKNDQIVTPSRPYRADSYILLSAGWDGEYGTADDICNFDWKYKP